MMREGEDWAFDTPEHVKVWSFGRKSHGRGGERGLTVESGAGEAGSGQEVGDGFQVNFVTQIQSVVGRWSSVVSKKRRPKWR
jgi:hypothetical protein